MVRDRAGGLRDALTAIAEIDDLEVWGRVAAVRGLLIEIAGPVSAMSVGGAVEIVIDRGTVLAEVIGFAAERALAMPFGSLEGVRRGCAARVRSAASGVGPRAAGGGGGSGASSMHSGGPSTARVRCLRARLSIRSGAIRHRPIPVSASADRSIWACAPSTPF
jgi:hypothetical protein